MNTIELKDILTSININPMAWSVNDSLADECYSINDHGSEWSVYYAERGSRTNEKRFKTESDACNYLISLLRSDSSTHLK